MLLPLNTDVQISCQIEFNRSRFLCFHPSTVVADLAKFPANSLSQVTVTVKPTVNSGVQYWSVKPPPTVFIVCFSVDSSRLHNNQSAHSGDKLTKPAFVYLASTTTVSSTYCGYKTDNSNFERQSGIRG